MGVNDALGAAGRSRGEVDVGDRVRRDLDRRWTGRARRQVVDHEHLARRPGDRRGEIGGLAVGEDEASVQLLRDSGEVLRRIGCLQRRVGLAGPQRPEDRRDAGEALPVDERDRRPAAGGPRRRCGRRARRAGRRSGGRRRPRRRGSPDGPRPRSRSGPGATAPPSPPRRRRTPRRGTGAARRWPEPPVGPAGSHPCGLQLHPRTRRAPLPKRLGLARRRAQLASEVIR